MNDVNMVFAPKYRLYGEKRQGKIASCALEIESEVCQADEHMPVLPKMSVSSFAGFLKGKSGLTFLERWSNIKLKYRNRKFR